MIPPRANSGRTGLSQAHAPPILGWKANHSKSSFDCWVLHCPFLTGLILWLVFFPQRDIGKIRSGMSKAQVIRFVVKPNYKFSNIFMLKDFGGIEAWAYPDRGMVVDFARFVTDSPKHSLRWFGPNTNDYVIVFGRNGNGLMRKCWNPITVRSLFKMATFAPEETAFRLTRFLPAPQHPTRMSAMKAILALEDWRLGLPRRGFWRAGHDLRRGVFQHVDDGLPGDSHRPVVHRPDRGDDVSWLIGNYGVNRQDVESWRPHVSGFVILANFPRVVSNWRADWSLAGISRKKRHPRHPGTLTRARLTKKLRVRGALNGFYLPPRHAHARYRGRRAGQTSGRAWPGWIM